MEEKMTYLRKYCLRPNTAKIHVFQPQEIKEIPLGELPEKWYRIFEMEDAEKRIKSMLDIWKEYSYEELRNTICYLEENMVNVELVKIDKRYFALYSIKHGNEEYYYEGGNPLDKIDKPYFELPKGHKYYDKYYESIAKNTALKEAWDKIPESIRCFYENVHNGFNSYPIKAMGLEWLQWVTYFDDGDEWGILENLEEPLQINLHTTFGFFRSGMGGYVAVDLSKDDIINEAVVWFSNDQPEYNVNFWDVVDEWIVIGLEMLEMD